MIVEEQEDLIEWNKWNLFWKDWCDRHPLEPDIHTAPGTWGPCCLWPKPTRKHRWQNNGVGEDGFFEKRERKDVCITSLSLSTGIDAVAQIMREGKPSRCRHFGEWDKYE